MSKIWMPEIWILPKSGLFGFMILNTFYCLEYGRQNLRYYRLQFDHKFTTIENQQLTIGLFFYSLYLLL